ncbi:MAG: hypothetical protein CME19_21535 [Gemmatimonadetes bacterium]|nr:hypothetical protein [Gemmatimonadota bacterium]|tara:strand:+ start:2003 stop:2740 length:738 start_codon:yes stop_codon:yes gene_type:complete
MSRRFILAAWLALSAVGSTEAAEPRWLVEAPTAGIPEHHAQILEVTGSSGRGLIVGYGFGFWNRFFVGASFGGYQLVGEGDTDWNPDPGLSVKLRLLGETFSRPAFTIGFRTQGYGPYDGTLERYMTKSLGVYVVFSRNYRHTMGESGVHFGLNRSLEDGDGDDTLTGFVGSDWEIGRRVAIVGEYHFAFNDDRGSAVGRGRGYLNTGIRVWVTRQLAVRFDLRDILDNNPAVQTPKTIRVEWLR